MRNRGVSIFVLSTAVIAVTVALAAPTAGASIRVGPPITGNPNGSLVCAGTCVRAPYLEGTTGVASPIDGVVVRWRVRATSVAGGPITLRIFRPVLGNFRFIGAGTGSPALALPPGTNSLGAPVEQATRVPLNAGDLVGMRFSAGVAPAFQVTSARNISAGGAVNDGFAANFSDNAAERLLMNADVEADADGDGFGDETQDKCPTNKATQGPCGGPATFGKAAMAKNGKSFGVKVACPVGPKACAGSVSARSSKRLRLSARGQKKVTAVVSFGEKAFSVPAGTTKTITFKLSAADRALLKRLKKIKVTLGLVASDGSAKRTSITLKTPKKKKARKK